MLIAWTNEEQRWIKWWQMHMHAWINLLAWRLENLHADAQTFKVYKMKCIVSYHGLITSGEFILFEISSFQEYVNSFGETLFSTNAMLQISHHKHHNLNTIIDPLIFAWKQSRIQINTIFLFVFYYIISLFKLTYFFIRNYHVVYTHKLNV